MGTAGRGRSFVASQAQRFIAVFGYGNVESGRGQHSLKRGSERDIVFDDKNWHEVSLRPYL